MMFHFMHLTALSRFAKLLRTHKFRFTPQHNLNAVKTGLAEDRKVNQVKCIFYRCSFRKTKRRKDLAATEA